MNSPAVINVGGELSKFYAALQATLAAAEDVRRLGLTGGYATALDSYLDHARITEIVFSPGKEGGDPMIYFVRAKGLHVGIPMPIIQEVGEGEDLDE